MKKLISLILFLTILLCSCNTDISENCTRDTHPVESMTNEEGAEITTEGSESVSSAYRYIREYEIAELLIIDSNANVAICDSRIFVFEQSSKTDIKQTVLDFDGTAEINAIPTPKEVSGIRYAMYPLSEERYLMLYQTDLLIMDADGNVMQSAQIPDNLVHAGFWDWAVSEDSDGGLHIFTYYENGLYYFDESLTLQTAFDQQVSLSAKPCVHEIDNGVFCFGEFASDISHYRSDDGVVTQKSLKVPTEMQLDRLIHGMNGEHYLVGDTGIQRYHDDRQPEIILRWDECGYTFGASDKYWVIDDETILLSRGNHDNGTYAHTLYLYRITKTAQPVTDKETITLLSLSVNAEDWLTKAVYQFNRTNSRYHINLVNDTVFFPEERKEAIETILLNGTGADMILPYKPDELFPYFDKNAFVDLNPYIGDQLFGCIRGLYGDGDAMYIVPMAFSFTTLIANTNVLHGQPLTWENFYAVHDSLPADVEFIVPRYDGVGAYSVDSNGNKLPAAHRYDLPDTLYHISLNDYADQNTKSSTYNTDAFRDMILCLQSMAETMDETVGGIENKAYIGDSRAGIAVSNGSLINRLRNSGVAFAEVEIAKVEHFSLIQRLFGDDTSYEICGYPSIDGGSVAVRAVTTPLAVLENSPNKEGCIEFINFLLSPEMQNDADNSFLPVSPEALAERLEDHQFYYYTKYDMGQLNTPGGGHISIQAPYYAAEYDEAFGDTEDRFIVYPVTDENRCAILDFFENIKICTTADETILEIVNEELSYWQNNARTLEETTKIIDSRVWIYLNE